jgi:molybdopterin-guanine dinucleotide biosynthesis protein A
MKYQQENRAKYTDISGIILSGGKSTRIGTDKALLKFGNETIIERVANLMKSLFQKIFIVTNTISEYRFLNVQLYEDIDKHKGPLLVYTC